MTGDSIVSDYAQEKFRTAAWFASLQSSLIAAFEKLTNDYRGTWIDRASRERLPKPDGDATVKPRSPNQDRP